MTLYENYNLLVVKPKSRKNIENQALFARKILNIAEETLYIDVLGILEFKLPSIFKDDFTYAVSDEWYREEEAYYNVRKNVIYIRSDVYDKAASGDGRSRFTIMHEIAHYILFKTWGRPYTLLLEEIAGISDATLKSMDPEWQASAFAGAFLCRNELVRNLEAEEIEKKCGVSRSAALVAYNSSRCIPYQESDYENFPNWSYIFAMQREIGQI